MTVLEALAVLEVATLQCQEREIEIDTPEVRDAFDLLEPYIRPEWLIPQFRYFLVHESDVRGEKEAQHHVLCTTFPVIRDSVKTLIEVRMDALDRKFHETRLQNKRRDRPPGRRAHQVPQTMGFRTANSPLRAPNEWPKAAQLSPPAPRKI